MTRGKKYIFYEDAPIRVSLLPTHFGDFLQKVKASAQESSHTTADLRIGSIMDLSRMRNIMVKG